MTKEEIVERIKVLAQDARRFAVSVPHTASADTGWLYANAEVLERGEPDEAGTRYIVRVRPRMRAEFLSRFEGRIEGLDG